MSLIVVNNIIIVTYYSKYHRLSLSLIVVNGITLMTNHLYILTSVDWSDRPTCLKEGLFSVGSYPFLETSVQEWSPSPVLTDGSRPVSFSVPSMSILGAPTDNVFLSGQQSWHHCNLWCPLPAKTQKNKIGLGVTKTRVSKLRRHPVILTCIYYNR